MGCKLWDSKCPKGYKASSALSKVIVLQIMTLDGCWVAHGWYPRSRSFWDSAYAWWRPPTLILQSSSSSMIRRSPLLSGSAWLWRISARGSPWKRGRWFGCWGGSSGSWTASRLWIRGRGRCLKGRCLHVESPWFTLQRQLRAAL